MVNPLAPLAAAGFVTVLLLAGALGLGHLTLPLLLTGGALIVGAAVGSIALTADGTNNHLED